MPLTPCQSNCQCLDEPTLNISSEQPDLALFCAQVTFTADPGLGQCPQDISCTRSACSTESQEAAYLEALRLAQECVYGQTGNGTCPPPPPPPGCEPFCPPPPCPPCSPLCPPDCPPPPPIGGVFLNQQQTCSVNCADGSTFSWTEPAGQFVGRTQQEANYIAFSVACRRAKQRRICFTSSLLDDGCVDEYYNQQITAQGGQPFVYPFINANTFLIPTECTDLVVGQIVPYHYEIVSGSLPAGLELGCFGYITGYPEMSGDYTFTVQINDSNGVTTSKEFTIHVDPCADSYGNITPEIFSPGSIKYWNSGNDIPAGHYRVTYVNGAMGYGMPGKWYVNADPNGAHNFNGYFVNNGSSQLEFPSAVFPNNPFGDFPSQAAVEAAYNGISISFYHSGGKIGMHLKDSPYGDNIEGDPNPTFKLEKV